MVIPKITLLYSGLLAFFYLILSLNVVAFRWIEKKGLGHNTESHSKLFRAVRIHGNFAEFIPFLITLMALDEMTGRSSDFLHAIGIGLIVGRIFHAIGLYRSIGPSPWRAVGVLTSFGPLAIFGYLLIQKALA